MLKAKKNKLKNLLEKTHQEFLKSNEISYDALEPALRYKLKVDIEFAAFICSVLAYGRVAQIKKSIHLILDPMGEFPVKKLVESTDKDLLKLTKNWKHRFNTSSDMFKLLKILQHIYQNHQTLEDFICAKDYVLAFDIIAALNQKFYFLLENTLGFSDSHESFAFFIPDPQRGSACKRMNLFLKWMVRDSAPDLGLWTTFHKKNLIIPLDTHVFKQAKSLGLTKRTTANWQTAQEITQKLSLLDSNDPTRYDFALCHLGIRGKVIRI